MAGDSCQKVTLVASSLGGSGFLTVATQLNTITYKHNCCSLAALSSSLFFFYFSEHCHILYFFLYFSFLGFFFNIFSLYSSLLNFASHLLFFCILVVKHLLFFWLLLFRVPSYFILDYPNCLTSPNIYPKTQTLECFPLYNPLFYLLADLWYRLPSVVPWAKYPPLWRWEKKRRCKGRRPGW